jgi:hypothetical protein
VVVDFAALERATMPAFVIAMSHQLHRHSCIMFKEPPDAHLCKRKEWQMTTLELTLNLPDDLAQEAQHAGLLTPQAIEAMLREQLRKLAGETLRTMWARRPDEELTPEIEQAIANDVRSARAALRKKTAN